MNRFFAALSFLASLALITASASSENNSHEQLHSALWVQSAAEYRAACIGIYRGARTQLEKALADKAWSAALEQDGDFSAKPPAVILDADETVLDNSAYQARLIEQGGEYSLTTWLPWCREQKASAVPGSLEFCKFAQDKGCTLFYVTNRDSDVRDATRENLKALGFPMNPGIETVLTRDKTSDKGPRRKQVCSGYRVLLQVGDQLTDFASDFNKQPSAERSALVKRFSEKFGERWIMLPNPMYGDWEASLYGYEFKLSSGEKIARKRAALRLDIEASQDARSLISSGPMPGYSEMTETAIWLQTTQAAQLRIRYWPKGQPSLASETAIIATNSANDHIALFRLTGLKDGQRFEYEVWVNGAPAKFDASLEFQTQPIWRWRGPAPDFSFTLGSCVYVNDTPFDRPGEPYGGEYETLGAIARERADFMLWMGDNTYLREADWVSESGIRSRYKHTRALPEMQALLAGTHHYAIWDDHDYGPNDSDRSFRLKRESLQTFKDYWPGVSYGTTGCDGCFSRFEWGDCEFFLLDDRYWRAPNNLPAGDEKVMFGPGQLRWLMDSLACSNATFKFIVNGNQMFNPMMNFESFGKCPAEQATLLRFLAEAQVDGVVVLSGDRHASELLKIERPGTFPLYEYTSSPITSRGGRSALEAGNPARIPGTWVTNQRNFGKIKVTGKPGERVLTLTAHDKEGKALWTHEIKEAELRTPRTK